MADWRKLDDFVERTFDASDDEHDYLLEAIVSVKSAIAQVETMSSSELLITGVAGEHYPCKPDIFEATYEPVDEEGE